MLPQQVEEGLFVLIPPKSVLCMADVKAVEMQLAEESLIAVAVRRAEDVGRPVAFVAAPLDDPAAAKQREARLRRVCRLAQRGESVHRKPISEIECDVL